MRVRPWMTAVAVAAAVTCRARIARARDLGDLLVERGIITQQDLEELRREAQVPAGAPASGTKRAAAKPRGATPAKSAGSDAHDAANGAVAATRTETPSRAVAGTGSTSTTASGVAPDAVTTSATIPASAATTASAPATSGDASLDALVKSEVTRQLPDWMRHFTLSTLIYMDWAYYLNTGYGPQFLTQLTPPGPGNDGFNSFDLTRSYINLVWKPSDRFTIRLTPNVYRELDTSAAVDTSKSSQVATNVNGNLSFRLKYGYMQVNDVWHGMNVRLGQMENPLIPWEEDLYGYRFVNLVPLNYLAYSSTDLGVAVQGPVEVDGTKWADYWLGFYNGSSFHALELNETRSPQGRVTLYPVAFDPAWKKLGLTYFMSYGYTNVAPDTQDAVIRRLAALLHYDNEYGGIAFEYDQTKNQNSFANFFTGAAPPQTIPDPNDPSQRIPNPVAQLYTRILNPEAVGRGYSLFGHLNLWDSDFSLFGMWQRWYPNENVPNDPLDFDRVVGGVAWRATSWMRVAVDSQNLMYVNHGPAVPADTHAIFTNLEINY